MNLKFCLFRISMITVCLLLIPLPVAGQLAPQHNDGFADEAFRRVWTRTDAPVATGAASRSWFWGERAGEYRYERYTGGSGNVRLVQYFDKARMEINDPAGDRASPWFVTSGRLVVEMISGQVRTGADTFETRAPANIPIAGNLEDNPEAPTYAMLQDVATLDGSDNRAEPRMGQPVSEMLGPHGISTQNDMALPETEIVFYEPATGHNIPRIFHTFLQARGAIIEQGTTIEGQIVDPLFVFGYPITEPYWARVSLGSEWRKVLFQAFERRILTYTPSNPPGWQVEMSNVGQHSMQWRYGRSLHYAQPPLAGEVVSYETTLTLPTYAYEQALIPTTPDDPIYPYPRLDRAQIGPIEERTYRAVVIENQFIEVTLLPDMGGRIYKAVNKATGHNIFYQNPVIKPSVFGQRGWWLSAGGLEWAAPTEEHGYMEAMPWELVLSPDSNGVTARLSAIEQQTGMQVEGRVALQADAGSFQVTMNVTNGTATSHPLQMWTNALLTPGGGDRISDELRFVMPGDEVIIHATQDNRLGSAGDMLTWPHAQGDDLSYPSTWQGYLGAFSPQPVPFLGVYDEKYDEGAAVLHAPDVVGAKFFGFSDNFDPIMYTDDESDYVELWSGAQTTFWDYPPLEAGQSRTITTDWLPLWGLGRLVTAGQNGALGLQLRADGGSTVTIATSHVLPEHVVVVQVDGAELIRTAPLPLRPDLPLAIDLPVLVGGGTLSFDTRQVVLRLHS